MNEQSMAAVQTLLDMGWRWQDGRWTEPTIPTESPDAWRKAMRCTNPPRYELTEAGKAVLEGEG